ncbi:MAG TPA: glycosyltransferase family 2 protein [Rubrivivax sp.]|nr:glycosyltransferase family 2 protein [Rubrivivax sp.]
MKSERPAISIVIPLYQKESTIRRALESVQRQSIAELEILVVDDGSTDGGPIVVQRLASFDDRIRLLTRPNGGPGAAKNSGLHEATGPLITFLDADDEWEPHFLESAKRVLDAHPECAVFASAFRIGPTGVDRWDELRRHGVVEGVWCLTPDIGDDELSLCMGVVHSCSSLFRTEAVRRFGGFYGRNGCRFGEDVYLWLQLLMHCAFFRSFEISAWYHTDASDLGMASGRRDLPLEPVFTDPGPIRDGCPVDLRPTLERWLNLHALRAVQMYAEFSDRKRVEVLLNAFPRVRRHWRSYASAWLKLRAPGLHRKLRGVTRGSWASWALPR